ncbi:uncharacterized protein LOC125037678 [Penaeus chinensis]|uniref:uncharacterized protein LOC125037678 n=1 Tax=Penaeus chinensis TaxID=139456 RepID=UPI001FB6EC26|nr:uncharacterized protein LOC125037678 [Penaeus chinensis]
MFKTTLERTSTLRTSLSLIGVFLALEVGKQLSNFGLMKTPREKRPLSPSLLVVLVEVIKMVVVVACQQVSRDSPKPWRASLKFAIPALCYLVNNFLYLNALAVTSPPVWLVLIQTRTLFTALAYKFVFGRELRWKQGLGCVLVVSSIVLTKLASLREDRNTISSALLVRSQVSALLSSTASLTIEVYHLERLNIEEVAQEYAESLESSDFRRCYVDWDAKETGTLKSDVSSDVDFMSHSYTGGNLFPRKI